ncbi:MAG: aldo/keto reductase, partial [Chloroflexi bacterium]|nr:aldo/keto reductase [Chloroflexota bacterium]
MQDLQRSGAIRFIGVTEHWSGDLEHQMLQRALRDGLWDVIMVGFNLLNQTARETVFRAASDNDIGVLIMFAIRRALSQPARLKSTLESLIESGEIEGRDLDLDNPLGFLLERDIAASIPDAAYRFARDEPGTHVILSGTGKAQHLDDNLATFARPPLPADITARLQRIFRNARSVTGG